MKKLTMILVLVLTVCLLGSAMADTVIVNPGNNVSVNVDVDSKDAVYALLTYGYERPVMTYQKTEFAEGFVSGASDGKLAVAKLGDGIKGVIAKIQFSVPANAATGTYEVPFTPVEVYNHDEKATTMTAKTQTVIVETQINSFVRRCYALILGRDPDAGGMKNWSDQLEAGTATASEIITGFTHSPEFLNRHVSNEDIVEILYNTMLNRGSDPPGKADWMSYLEVGCSDASVINGFCGSQEFGNLCASYGITPGSTQAEERDRNKNVTAFVTRCYAQALNRGGDVSGLNHWCQQLMDRIQTPKQVASGFVFSQEMINRNLSNGELVDMLYRLYLGREADPPGRENWVTLMENGMTLEQLNDGFADSQEFANIVASYGL